MEAKPKNIKNKTKEEIMVENLRDIREIFDKHNIKFWLDWGTLLGAIRNGKIIEWDHDIDLGIREEDFKKISPILPEIKKRAFFISKPLLLFQNLRFIRSGYAIEIWSYSQLDENRWQIFTCEVSKSPIARILYFIQVLFMHSKADIKITMPSNRFKFTVAFLIKHLFFLFSHAPYRFIFFLTKTIQKVLIRNNYIKQIKIVISKHYFGRFKNIKFYGMTFNIPFEAEKYLKYKYGKDWRIPKKKWDPWREDGAVINAKSE